MSVETTAVEKKLSIKDMKEFFGYTKLTEFSADWKSLTEEDRAQIRGGILDGTYNY